MARSVDKSFAAAQGTSGGSSAKASVAPILNGFAVKIPAFRDIAVAKANLAWRIPGTSAPMTAPPDRDILDFDVSSILHSRMIHFL